jgi:hypothetical protein
VSARAGVPSPPPGPAGAPAGAREGRGEGEENHHQHFETGNVEIFRREPLATESGEYTDYGSSHSVNWLIRTIAHNAILVHRPGEAWTMLRDGGRNA